MCGAEMRVFAVGSDVYVMNVDPAIQPDGSVVHNITEGFIVQRILPAAAPPVRLQLPSMTAALWAPIGRVKGAPHSSLVTSMRIEIAIEPFHQHQR